MKKDEANLIKEQNRIEKFKSRSVALMEQITTISKMRIYNPTHRKDFLYSIKLSDVGMDKINDSIKKLFIH